MPAAKRPNTRGRNDRQSLHGDGEAISPSVPLLRGFNAKDSVEHSRQLRGLVLSLRHLRVELPQGRNAPQGQREIEEAPSEGDRQMSVTHQDTKKLRTMERNIVRAARSWYFCDRPSAGRPSGLRLLTAKDVWEPSPAELRLARRISEYLDAGGQLGKRK